MFDQSYQGLPPPVSAPEKVPSQQRQQQQQQQEHKTRDAVSGYTSIPPSSFHEMINAPPNGTSAAVVEKEEVDNGHQRRSRASPGREHQDQQQRMHEESRSYIEIRVLQASPLACRLKDGTIQRIEALNLKKERTILNDVVDKHQRQQHRHHRNHHHHHQQKQQHQLVDVDISFDIATLDSVGDYLMHNNGGGGKKNSSSAHISHQTNNGRNNEEDTTTNVRILHLSCHGTSGYFALEDSTGTGGMDGLNVQVLRRWLATASNRRCTPDIIVLSACQSRVLGDACARYGQVPHVICAAASDTTDDHDDKDDEEDLHEEYSMEFTKILYRQLFSGATVRQAFDAATLQASAYRHFKGQTGFCLLPEDGDHNVALHNNIKSSTNPSVTLPGPPLWNNEQQLLNLQNDAANKSNNSTTESTKRFEIVQQLSAAVRYNGGLYFAGNRTGNNTNISPVHYCSPSVSPSPPVKNRIDRNLSPKLLSKRSLPPEMSSLSPSSSSRSEHRDHNWKPSPPQHIETSRSASIRHQRIDKQLLAKNPPEFYVRHDLEMYNVIQAIGAARIVWVSGSDGVGKRTLVQASCSYLKDRREMNGVEEIFWSSQCVDNTGNISEQFSGLVDALQNVVRADGRSILIVVDAKRLPDGTGSMLSQHLQQLIETDSSVKLVVIHDEQDRDDLRIGHYPCVELKLSVDKLSLESTVKLFGAFCQHVLSQECPGIMCPETLWRLLAPETGIAGAPSQTPQQHRLNPQQQPFSQLSLNSSSFTGSFVPSSHESESSPGLSKRHRVIFRLLGDGFPRQVIKAAKTITKTDFDKIIFLGKFKELDGTDCASHNGLLRFQVDVARAIVSSVRKGMSEQSSKLQLKYDCITLVKGEMKSLMTLRNDLLQIQRDISRSRKRRDMHRVMHLFREQQKHWKLLQVEVDAISNTTNPFQITKPEILDKCHTKQTIMESVLVHVQNILLDVALQSHLAVESTGNIHETNVATRILKDAERLLLEAKLGNLKPWCIPKTNTAPPPTLASYVGKHRLSSDSIVGSQKDIHLAASLIQKQVRRHYARRKVEWLRVFRDLTEPRRLLPGHRRKVTTARRLAAEHPISERIQISRQQRKNLDKFPTARGQPAEHPMSERIQIIRQQMKKVEEDQEDQEDLATTTTAASTILTSPSTVSTPSTPGFSSDSKKTKNDGKSVFRPLSNWKSPLDFWDSHDSQSMQMPLEVSQSKESSVRREASSVVSSESLPMTPSSTSGSDRGRPASSIMLSSQSFSDSSLDLSLDVSERTVAKEAVHSSWWKLGPDLEQDDYGYGASSNNTGDIASRQMQNRAEQDRFRHNSRKKTRHFRERRNFTSDRRWGTGCAPSSQIMPQLPVRSTSTSFISNI